MRAAFVAALLLLGAGAAAAQTLEGIPRLYDAVKAACPSVLVVRIDLTVAPQDQQACAQPTIDAFDWSQAAQAAHENLQARTAAKTQWAATDKTGKALRCYAQADLSELNIMRGLWMAFKAEVAAASSLADLKTRVAALANTNDRTMTQVRNAIDNCVDSGAQD